MENGDFEFVISASDDIQIFDSSIVHCRFENKALNVICKHLALSPKSKENQNLRLKFSSDVWKPFSIERSQSLRFIFSASTWVGISFFFLLFKKIVKTKFTFYILHHLRKLKFTTFFLWSPLHTFLCLIIYSVLTKNDWTNFHWEYFCLNN